MDSNFKETIWMVLVFFILPQPTTTCPTTCECFSSGEVMCSGLVITDVPRSLPVHTYLLILNGTNMTEINEKSLANKEKLLRFRLTHSHLHTINPGAFHVAQQLKSVMLSSNDLFILPERVFSPLTTLEQLDLHSNKLDTITPDMLDGLGGLLDLDLSQNRLTSPTSEVFNGLTNLTSLNLGKNSIQKLPPTIFHSLTKLINLTLYKNEIEVLEPGLFNGLENLQMLKIFQNKIASIPPQIFWPLRNLEILSMSSNRLQAVPERSFYHMPKLTKLTLYNNPLLSLPGELMGHMPNIAEFYLYGTKLQTVPGNLFTNMSGLTTLKLHLNEKLWDLPPDLFCCLSFLRELSLKVNNLHHLHPQLFSKLTTLDKLFLNDNKLENLPENIFNGLGGLKSIDLKNNHLKTLPREIFTSNDALTNLKLSGNPWNCTCAIRDTARWIRLNEHVVTDMADVMCHSPFYYLLRTVSSLHDEEFSFCNDKQLFHESSSYGPTLFVPSTNTAPKTTALLTPQAATQHVFASTKSSSVMPLTSTIRTTSIYEDGGTTAQTTEDDRISQAFHDKLVIEEGPNFVHHNIYKGWVYVWFLYSSVDLVGLLMFSHILLVVTGLLLILASMYTMWKLGKVMNDLSTEIMQIERE